MTSAGLLTDEEMNKYLALFDDAQFVAMDYILTAVLGRRALLGQSVIHGTSQLRNHR
jgi:hypothetical protein